MTEPSNLQDAAEVTVTEADQSAAEAWLNANNGEWIDALNLAEAFARHRQAAYAAGYQATADRIEALEAEVAELQKALLDRQDAHNTFAQGAVSEVAMLSAENERLREALEWYVAEDVKYIRAALEARHD